MCALTNDLIRWNFTFFERQCIVWMKPLIGKNVQLRLQRERKYLENLSRLSGYRTSQIVERERMKNYVAKEGFFKWNETKHQIEQRK